MANNQKLALGRLASGAAVVAAVIPGGAATASLVTVSQSVSLNDLLQESGGLLSGSFNINGLVGTSTSRPFVVSGSIEAFGYSNINYAAPVNANYTGYQNVGGYYAPFGYTAASFYCYYSWGGGCNFNGYYYVQQGSQTVRYFDQSYDVQHIDNVADQLSVRTDGATATATAVQTSASATGYSTYAQTWMSESQGYPNYVDNYYYDRSRDVYSAIFGEVDPRVALGASAIADLNASGLLGFDLLVPRGQVSVNNVVLTVTYDDAPIGEPETAALLLGALALLGVAVRRRLQ